MKFASEEIRTKAVKAYLKGKASAKSWLEFLAARLAQYATALESIRHNQAAAKPNGHRKNVFQMRI